MSDFATTTTLDKNNNVSVSSSSVYEVEEKIDNFNQDSTTIDYSYYSATDREKYPEFMKSFEKALNWAELLNKEQIMDFIFNNVGLLELIQNVEPIIKEHFPENSFGLEYEDDPEISSLNKLVLYVKGEESSFDEDWEEVKKVNREIRRLSLYDDSVKRLFSVDLW